MEEEGRIWRHVGRGTFVGPRPEAGQTVLSSVTAVTNPAEVMESRLALEPKLASLAALRASPNDLAQMETYIVQSRKVMDTTEYENWDGMIHLTIARAANNSLLLALFNMVNNARQSHIWGRLKEASLNTERRKLYSDQHQEILETLKDRDSAAAEKKMRVHIEDVNRHLLNPN